MQRIRHITTVMIAMLALLLCACDKIYDREVSGLGRVRFSISVDENPISPPIAPFSLIMTDTDGKFSHSWTDIQQFPEYDSYYVGSYTATAVSGDIYAEGYDCQSYCGMANFDILESQTQQIDINCSLVQAQARANFDDKSHNFQILSATFHSKTWGYVDYAIDQSKTALIQAGTTSFYVSIADMHGKQVTIAPKIQSKSSSGSLCIADVAIDEEDLLVVSCNGQSESLQLSQELFDSQAPVIRPIGYEAGESVHLVEGYPADHQLGMQIESSTGISSAMLIMHGLDQHFLDLPRELDLCKDTDLVQAYGLQLSQPDEKHLVVDYSQLLEDLAMSQTSNFQFVLRATDLLSRASEPLALDVDIQSIVITQAECSKAMLGVDLSTITLQVSMPMVEPGDFSIQELDEYGSPIREIEILSSEVDTTNSSIQLCINIGEGVHSVPIRIDYMGLEKCTLTVNREVPQYQLALDSFSTYALAQISCQNAATTAVICNNVKFYDNDKPLDIAYRDAEAGVVKIDGLSPGNQYDLKAVVIEGSFTPNQNIRTERAEGVPDGDFEDTELSISYQNLAQGGAYSNTSFPIFNMQNTNSMDVYLPKAYWTTVNSKTFCKSAKNPNTWYKQVSAMADYSMANSGNKSIMLATVGWSLDGAEIPPYAQEPDEYVPYNTNIPMSEHFSAGKIFLGKYSFDPYTLTETYSEGIDFASRPSSLNGFTRYVPATGASLDQGLIVVTLINDILDPPVTIARSEMKIYSSSDFIAFNLPILYEEFGIKATKLQIMISASCQCGDIEYEDTHVPVGVDVENSRFIGSQLWIDNLTFSY